jgi:hypothetical protein
MAKNKKLDPERKEDVMKRDDEMAEGRSPDVVKQIYGKGGKYYCAECHSELPIHTDCPSCHAHIDWDRVRMEGHP